MYIYIIDNNGTRSSKTCILGHLGSVEAGQGQGEGGLWGLIKALVSLTRKSRDLGDFVLDLLDI